jgi:SAM-dependent methyltransferase
MFEQSNFDNTARYYDLFELKSRDMYERILALLDDLFKRQGVTSVLDMTCGTGAQAIGLCKRGYNVTACDISAEMVRIAEEKARGLPIRFHQGDIRSSRFGIFDAVIAMFNSVGYLGKADFVQAIGNVRENLKPGGVFVFDNTNLGAIRAGHLNDARLIDTAGEHEGVKFVRFTQAQVDVEQGLMTIEWEAIVQHGFTTPEALSGTWYRQIYTVGQLGDLMEAGGFRILEYHDRYSGSFSETDSFTVVIVSQRS